MPFVCTTCHWRGLMQLLAGGTPAYSDVAAKRAVTSALQHRQALTLRAAFLDFVRNSPVPAPLVFVIDHFLPYTAADHTQGSYLSEELLRLPNVGRRQIFSPNVNPSRVPVPSPIRSELGNVPSHILALTLIFGPGPLFRVGSSASVCTVGSGRV